MEASDSKEKQAAVQGFSPAAAERRVCSRLGGCERCERHAIISLLLHICGVIIGPLQRRRAVNEKQPMMSQHLQVLRTVTLWKADSDSISIDILAAELLHSLIYHWIRQI